MTPEQALSEASSGTLRPVYVVVGEERLLADRVTGALREAATKGGVPGFNEDKFIAGESDVSHAISACKTLPMMAKRRLVMIRGLERWEKKGDDDDGDTTPAASRDAKSRGGEPGSKRSAREALAPLDALAEYAKAPVDTTVLVLSATKLNGQRRLMTAAKKGGFLVSCDPLARRDLPAWIQKNVRDRGHAISFDTADLLAELAGPDLGYVADCLERLSLYVGPGVPFTEDAIAAVVTRVRKDTAWELLDALGKRRVDRALALLDDAFDPRDGGLRLLGLIAWSLRQLVKFDAALREGASPADAAGRSGVAPFKAQAFSQTLRAMPRGTMEKWTTVLADADLALKGSRRTPQAVLEAMVVDMCR